MRKTPAERFTAKVRQTDGHWEWTAGTNSNGHGSFWVDDKMRTAQRAAWLLFRGPITDASGVVSTCGKGQLCVAPDHLELRAVGPEARPVEERILPFISRGEPSECWPWTGNATDHGYGGIRDNDGRMIRAHRVVWRIENGDVPAGHLIRHSCDNPRCCNPAHLSLGTQVDNMADMRQRKRDNPVMGERDGNSKLTNEQIMAIRSRHAAGEKQVALAAEFGVHRTTIERIVHRQTWKHI